MTQKILRDAVLYRTYSRINWGKRESWQEIVDRVMLGICDLGNFTQEEQILLRSKLECNQAFPAGRSLWVAGTSWSKKQANFPGFYNCVSVTPVDWQDMVQLMNLSMTGCGTGAVLLPDNLQQLPQITNQLTVEIVALPGEKKVSERQEHSSLDIDAENCKCKITVGDSRQGWVSSLYQLLCLASDDLLAESQTTLKVQIDLSSVRSPGEILQGFGGVANPQKLPDLYPKIAQILNKAQNRQLTVLEACLIIDEAALIVVAGGIRRSAGIRQAEFSDPEFATAKLNLWQKNDEGNWQVDPERAAMRMANHTRMCFKIPTEEECIAAVTQQVRSGEGAIQYVPEALARANADLLFSRADKNAFISDYLQGQGLNHLSQRAAELNRNLTVEEAEHCLERFGLNPCVTKETWIHTEKGARQVKDLIGKQLSLYVNGELFSTTQDGFWSTGVKPIFRVITSGGYELRLTKNHKLLKVQAQTQRKQYAEWVEVKNLIPGDLIMLQNHRSISPWEGNGSFDEGWLLGSLLGDDRTIQKIVHAIHSLGKTAKKASHAMLSFKKTVDYSLHNSNYCYDNQLKDNQNSFTSLANAAKQFTISKQNELLTSQIERTSYDFYCGFLKNLFDVNGSIQHDLPQGISIRLSQSNFEFLKVVQRMLARLGIITRLNNCNPQYELIIANDNIYYFQEIIGFQEPKKVQKLQDLLSGKVRKLNRERFATKILEIIPEGEEPVFDCTVPAVSQFDANGLVAHNCGEIIGKNFFCNLTEVHLNQHDPLDIASQIESFKAASLYAVAMLHHQFDLPKFQASRNLDPIIGVSFTGLFDFFVKLFGRPWLLWWQQGRRDDFDESIIDRKDYERIISRLILAQNAYPKLNLDLTEKSLVKLFSLVEVAFLKLWKATVSTTVRDYCELNELKMPNRFTTVQPAGTKSLLTNASCGWHPPKFKRYIRRITFSKNDPIALACIAKGYKVVPGQSDVDNHGNLLKDPYDERVTTWLLEIPLEVSWIEEARDIDLNFSALAQIDFYLTVQQNYTTHNTSATFEVTESEITAVGKRIHSAIVNNEGYVSAAILARSLDNNSFPRLPYEPITEAKYREELAQIAQRCQVEGDFIDILNSLNNNWGAIEGPAGCDSDKCLIEN